jgi:hypothetical protein
LIQINPGGGDGSVYWPEETQSKSAIIFNRA